MSAADHFITVFWTILGAATVFSIGGICYQQGHKAGVVAEWNRINDQKLERDRLRRLRDGRTREFKQMAKSALPNAMMCRGASDSKQP